jgi:hypothetical protein
MPWGQNSRPRSPTPIIKDGVQVNWPGAQLVELLLTSTDHLTTFENTRAVPSPWLLQPLLYPATLPIRGLIGICSL